MTLEALAKRGNFFHVYDFRVKPGTGFVGPVYGVTEGLSTIDSTSYWILA